MSNKDDIIKLFHENVKGKKVDVSSVNQKHDGKKGHWLERQFGITANGKNEPDLYGYELKNETTSKISFGDWSANRYIFTDTSYKSEFPGKKRVEKRDRFLRIFGKPNEKKEGRCSWSGSPCPKIDKYNDFGQILVIEENKDIVARYSYSQDKRENKSEIVPLSLQKENLELARWFGVESPSNKKGDKCLKKKLEDKFGKGWFTCKTDGNGTYQKICFGGPIKYDEWLGYITKEEVFFDSGMHEGNPRPYSEFRANNNFWDSMIEEEYE